MVNNSEKMEGEMRQILTRCGYRCDLCLAYKDNLAQNPSVRDKLSDGWFKYFGFRIQPQDIYCDGCLENLNLLDSGCPVRPCVIEKGLENCSQCDQYVCEKLQERLVVYEGMKEKHGGEISEDDYLCFIRPYENKKRLEALRASTGKTAK